MYQPHLLGAEVVGRHHRPQPRLLLKRRQIVPHPRHHAHRRPLRRRVFLGVEARRLLVQQKDEAVRAAARRRGRGQPASDDGGAGARQGGARGLEARLDPVEDGAEDIEGGVGGVEVDADGEVGVCGGGGTEGNFGGGLRVWVVRVSWGWM